MDGYRSTVMSVANRRSATAPVPPLRKNRLARPVNASRTWMIILTKRCMQLALCVLFIAVPLAKAQNWNAAHLENAFTDPNNARMWSEAMELAHDVSTTTTPYPYSDCAPLGWSIYKETSVQC